MTTKNHPSHRSARGPVPVSVEAKLSFVEPGRSSPPPCKAPGISYQGTMKTSVRMLKPQEVSNCYMVLLSVSPGASVGRLRVSSFFEPWLLRLSAAKSWVLAEGFWRGPLIRMFPLSFQSIISNQMRPWRLRVSKGSVGSLAEHDLAICSLGDQEDVFNLYWKAERCVTLTTEGQTSCTVVRYGQKLPCIGRRCFAGKLQYNATVQRIRGFFKWYALYKFTFYLLTYLKSRILEQTKWRQRKSFTKKLRPTNTTIFPTFPKTSTNFLQPDNFKGVSIL